MTTCGLKNYTLTSCHLYVSGPFITEAYVTCPPSTERFKVSPVELVPQGRSSNEGKGKKPSAAEVEEEEDGNLAAANWNSCCWTFAKEIWEIFRNLRYCMGYPVCICLILYIVCIKRHHVWCPYTEDYNKFVSCNDITFGFLCQSFLRMVT